LLAGAWIGCAKDDIKKALAGSTMSQIGYMMLAAGLGPAGYAFAIFHLLTHGFFKANMFLGAGSVMHGMNDDVNMRHYGGLRKAMPITFYTFAAGYLAILGFPGTSGFFSKDKIIEAALAHNVWVGIAALIGAGVTAFYMTRMMLMTFFGEKRWRENVHPHESPSVMTTPLIVLGAASLFAGLVSLGNWIEEWLEPATGHIVHLEPPLPIWAITTMVLITVAIGVAVAWFTYGTKPIADETPADADVSVLTRAGRAELYGNQINDVLVVKPVQYLTKVLAWADDKVVDGAVGAVAGGVGGLSQILRTWQTGFVRSYALAIFGGAVFVVLALLVVTLG
ncbi:MAG: NADH-quinone oxidoreductase subunit L, partial [Actinomycetales bacterium]|nr:NADH-quinone oxidoreductase subunit L [Actinomycetales bacterium]